MPTTAGTGSEVTGGIVMVDESRGLKVGAASPHNRAARCLVDPELTHGLPREPTLYGGVDALAQGIAAAVVRVRTPVAIAIGLEAARLAAEALPVVAREPGDRAARSAMACASLMAGFAMNLSEAGTEHSLAHALGALPRAAARPDGRADAGGVAGPRPPLRARSSSSAPPTRSARRPPPRRTARER